MIFSISDCSLNDWDIIKVNKSNLGPEGREGQILIENCHVNLAQVWNKFMIASSGFNDPGWTKIVYISSSDSRGNEEQEMAIHSCMCQTLFVFWKHYQKHIREHELLVVIEIKGRINILIVFSPEEERDETDNENMGHGQECKAEEKV